MARRRSLDILLVSPLAPSKLLGGNFYFRLPFLGLPTVAAYTPPGDRVRIVDEKVSPIPWEPKPDLVGITAMTPLAPRAYQIADRFRAMGVPVVMGGMHPTVMAEEALRHADAVVVGEAEGVWPRVVEEAREGRLSGLYLARDRPDLAVARPPRRDLLEAGRYLPVTFIETSRGCPHACRFCSVTRFFGGRHRTFPVDDVVAQLRELRPTERRFALKNCVFFVDDNIIGDPDHALALFEAIRPFRLKWFGQASISLAERPDLLEAMAASGCLGLEMGFETLCEDAEARRIGKPVRDPKDVLEAVEVIRSHGIGLQGSFIFGFDHDDPGVFERTARFVDRARLNAVYVGILTPYPGTALHARLRKEGRLLHERWEEYDTAHVVFRPRRMTPRQLLEGYHRVLRHVYSWRSMGRRLLGSRVGMNFFVPMNLGFKVSLRRFLRDAAAE
ncbi:B12-binding domain-containing radical SAM protein [Dissulfurirhabdus thermomarina]|uniref:B12-binding domain-containing radical SAM protein n=1 Tax=Dissulfurirhabdus thermomarina TaxID=1765737 RepID=A0A6N9TNJ4_DISTH|nr:radical SAM protein [Dissulfurirhabdus thermomarina]NDY42872.1 B12-binding domain-containing radical SAM protein [Dissulfurirhabdus thermomarina]NMX24429.1 B12-binding domain-containing radical SAM protein [Dissulfurirhabdus thermomarina]